MAGEEQMRGTVRVAAPFTLRCDSCRTIVPRGRRFNARKSTLAPSPAAPGVPVHRFAIRCPACPARLSWRTDPATFGFACDSGATRLHAKEERAPRGDPAAGEESDPVRRAERRAAEQRARLESEAHVQALIDRRIAQERQSLAAVGESTNGSEGSGFGGDKETSTAEPLGEYRADRPRGTLAERRAALGIVTRKRSDNLLGE